MQGVMVQQDVNNWVRADYYYDGANLRFFVASFTGGAPTVRTDIAVPAPSGSSVWVRVARTGNNWTMSSSGDGTNWTTRATFN